MNDNAIGIIGAALIVGIPALIAAIASLSGNRQTKTSNGNTLAQLIEQALAWQVRHGADDLASFSELQRQLGVLEGRLQEKMASDDTLASIEGQMKDVKALLIVDEHSSDTELDTP